MCAENTYCIQATVANSHWKLKLPDFSLSTRNSVLKNKRYGNKMQLSSFLIADSLVADIHMGASPSSIYTSVRQASLMRVLIVLNMIVQYEPLFITHLTTFSKKPMVKKWFAKLPSRKVSFPSGSLLCWTSSEISLYSATYRT